MLDARQCSVDRSSLFSVITELTVGLDLIGFNGTGDWNLRLIQRYNYRVIFKPKKLLLCNGSGT